MDEQAHRIIHQLVLAESLVPALMVEHPHSKTHCSLQTCFFELIAFDKAIVEGSKDVNLVKRKPPGALLAGKFTKI